MTAPNGPFIGKGTTLSTSATSTFTTAFAKVLDIVPPGSKFSDVDVTGYDSTIEDFIPGYENAGECNFVINYDETQSASLYALRGVTKQYWQIQLPDGSGPTTGTKMVFQGYLNDFQVEPPAKGQIKSKIKIKLQSVVTFTAPT